jgi:cytochrome c-type biogenesis protein CcmH
MKKQRALLLIIAIVVILAAIWSYVLLVAPARESLDQRVHDVASQLKCPVCQGESVADSPSTISQQMRGVIRQQLQQGQSEQQIIQYFVSRYGSTILWSPPRQGFAILAWIIPIAILLSGALLLILVVRGWLNVGRATRRGEANANTLEDGQLDSDELQQFQAQLDRELAADDPIFAHLSHTEARATARVAPTIHETQRPARQSRGDPRGRPGNASKEASS